MYPPRYWNASAARITATAKSSVAPPVRYAGALSGCDARSMQDLGRFSADRQRAGLGEGPDGEIERYEDRSSSARDQAKPPLDEDPDRRAVALECPGERGEARAAGDEAGHDEEGEAHVHDPRQDRHHLDRRQMREPGGDEQHHRGL